jgi:hypothetical protein
MKKMIELTLVSFAALVVAMGLWLQFVHVPYLKSHQPAAVSQQGTR